MNKIAKKLNLLKIGAVLMLAFAWAVVPFLNNETVKANETSSDIRIGASLNGAAIGGVTPSGYAEHRYEPDDSGERRRLSVQAFSVNLPNGTLLDISVNNAIVGQIAVNNGSGFFNIDTNNGQNVPSVGNGNPIALRQGANVVLSGTFGIVTASPSPSVSPSGSPTGSPSPSPSGSPTGSPSPSPSVSPSGSPSPSPSVSPSSSPSPSPSVSPSASPSPTVSPSPTGSPSPSPSPNSGDLFAALSGATVNGVLPNGFAQYELHSSRTELEIRVYQVNLPSGTALAVSVNNNAVGNLILEGGGEGRLRLRSDRGEFVPVITAGMTITLRSGAATILSGTFAGGSASPSPSPSPSPSGSPSPSPSGSPSPSPSGSPSPSPSPSPGRYFEAHLTGSQTAANGEIKIFLNQAGNQATVTGEFHNLSSAQTSARIISAVGDSSVVYTFPTIGGTNGNFAGATIPISAAQAAQLRTGLWSAVIASANNPNGEIQGQLRTHSNSSDFDGDGSNDIAVFRPNTGTWYIQNSEGFSARIIGTVNDKLVSGDYDGDGKTDAAVFRNLNGAGVWSIQRSSDAGVTEANFGFGTDQPVRGDFDGDGRNDLAVFRASNGTWYIQRNNGAGFVGVQFGQNGDVPVGGDFDGDGKADISIFRPSNGVWYYLRSSDGAVRGYQFGQNGDVPTSGDFDGDGKADISVFRPSNGVWYIFRSSDSGYDFRQFGLSSDVPVAGNYDGDHKTDIAVFRPSNGTWYVWRSVDNTYSYQPFGQSGDVPTPSR